MGRDSSEPPFAKVATTCTVILTLDADSIPSVDAKEVVLYRLQKPPSTHTGPGALLSKHDKVTTVKGLADDFTVFVIKDGSKDHWGTLPSVVKKSFPSSKHVVDHMQFTDAPKLYAIVLSEYKTKGPWSFDVTDLRLRTGFGRCVLKWIPPTVS